MQNEDQIWNYFTTAIENKSTDAKNSMISILLNALLPEALASPPTVAIVAFDRADILIPKNSEILLASAKNVYKFYNPINIYLASCIIEYIKCDNKALNLHINFNSHTKELHFYIKNTQLSTSIIMSNSMKILENNKEIGELKIIEEPILGDSEYHHLYEVKISPKRYQFFSMIFYKPLNGEIEIQIPVAWNIECTLSDILINAFLAINIHQKQSQMIRPNNRGEYIIAEPNLHLIDSVYSSDGTPTPFYYYIKRNVCYISPQLKEKPIYVQYTCHDGFVDKDISDISIYGLNHLHSELIDLYKAVQINDLDILPPLNQIDQKSIDHVNSLFGFRSKDTINLFSDYGLRKYSNNQILCPKRVFEVTTSEESFRYGLAWCYTFLNLGNIYCLNESILKLNGCTKHLTEPVTWRGEI